MKRTRNSKHSHAVQDKRTGAMRMTTLTIIMKP